MVLEGSLTDISNPSREPIQVMSQLGIMTLLATGLFLFICLDFGFWFCSCTDLQYQHNLLLWNGP